MGKVDLYKNLISLEDELKNNNELLQDFEKKYHFESRIFIDDDYLKIKIVVVSNSKKEYDLIDDNYLDMTTDDIDNYIMNIISRLNSALNMVALLDNIR